MRWSNLLTHAEESGDQCGLAVDFVRPMAPWWDIEEEKRSDISQRSLQCAPKGERKGKLGQLCDKMTTGKTITPSGELGTLCVKMTTGKTITLSIKFTGNVPAGTVDTVRTMIWEKEGVPFDQQRIQKGKVTMEDGRLLQEYNIRRGDTLHVLLRIRGGGRGGSAPAYGRGGALSRRMQTREKSMQQREAEVQKHLHDARMLNREAKV